jgi:probable rRNA maturation factor
MGVDIEIFLEGGISLPYRDVKKREIKHFIKRICDIISLHDVSITLIVTDNEFIRDINRRYRNQDSPTDIITFAYREDPFPRHDSEVEHLGDIYLSLERAFENSLEYSVDFISELKLLLVHGVLHLVGYDHEVSERDDKKMRDREQEILRVL